MPTISLPPLPPGGRYTSSFFSRPPSTSTLNRQTPLSDILKNDTAEGKPIPLVYGEAKVGGMPFAIDYDSGTWTVGYALCYGEIEDIVSVTLNGAAAVSGVTIDEYLGTTSQTANSKLSTAISGYSDTLVISDPAGDIGVAYIVVQYTDSHYDSWPQVIARVKGKKVRNPRHLEGDIYNGNGSNYGTLGTAITLSGDFTIDLSFTRVDRSADRTILLGDDGGSSNWIGFFAADHATAPDDVRVNYAGAVHAWTAALSGLTGDIRVKLQLSGTSLEAFINGVSVGTNTVTVGAFTIDCVGAFNGGSQPMLSGLRIGKIRIRDDSNGDEWRWNCDEGTGTTSSNSVAATGTNNITWTASSWTTISEAPEFSENPGAQLVDLIESANYGLGKSIDDYGAIDVMDYCDDEAPGETRRQSYLVIDQAQDSYAVSDILRGYASCFMVNRGNTFVLRPDKPGSSVKSITAADIDRDSIKIVKRDTADMPTVVRAYYTDTTGTEWREKLCDPAKASGVDAGTTPWREQRIRLTGIKRHSQAYRECVERLNKETVSDVTVQWDMYDDAMPLELGDIVEITHPLGLTAYKVRIDEPPRETSPGRWSLAGSEYRDAAYSDAVESGTSYSDGALPGESLFGPGVTVYKQGTKPTAAVEGDIWFDTSDQDRTHHHDGSDFENVDKALISVTGTKQDANFTAEAYGRYPIDTETNGTFTMELPSSPEAGTTVHFFDAEGYFDQAHLNITSPDKKILELNEDFEVDRRYFSGGLQFIDDTIGWTLI